MVNHPFTLYMLSFFRLFSSRKYSTCTCVIGPEKKNWLCLQCSVELCERNAGTRSERQSKHKAK